MNIKEAKNEIKNTVQAYLGKDDKGDYKIPPVRQRPVLLMGPPGIGKTQIMEQIARECKVALVAYNITHHTRQSAVGLPFIREASYGGKTYSVTEYTMSEIIASVYRRMEETGLKEDPVCGRDQLRIGNAGTCYAAVPAGKDVWQPEDPGGMGDRGSRQSTGI